MRTSLAIVFWVVLLAMSQAQDKTTTLIINAGTSYRYTDRIDVPITAGVGVEAAVNNRWSVTGDLSLASNHDFRFTFVDAAVKYYPFKRTRPLFFYAGPGFCNVTAKGASLESPFSSRRGDQTAWFKFSFGIGASAFVKERFYVGFFLGTGLISHGNLEPPYGESGLRVGYGF